MFPIAHKTQDGITFLTSLKKPLNPKKKLFVSNKSPGPVNNENDISSYYSVHCVCPKIHTLPCLIVGEGICIIWGRSFSSKV